MHPHYQYPSPYDYPGRSEMTMSDMNMDQMKQMMQEHMDMTKQIYQKINKIEERLYRMEILMNMR